MKIVRARLKPLGGATLFETIPNKIKSLITNYTDDNFDFVIRENNRLSTKSYGKDHQDESLKGKKLNIERSSIWVTFNEDGSVTAEIDTSVKNEVMKFNNFIRNI
jgi:hypothetical protein